MFQFSAFAFRLSGMPCLLHGGLPHSETRGSIRVCRSPRFIAACRVLHRLWEPRHPPCALLYFLPGAPLLLGAPAPGPGTFPRARRCLLLCLLSLNMSMNSLPRLFWRGERGE